MAQCRPCKRRIRNPLRVGVPGGGGVIGVPVVGSLAVTLEPATLSAAAVSFINGALAVTLDDATLVAVGESVVAGALAVTLDDATLAATGNTFDALALEDGTGDWQFESGSVIEWG